MNKDFVNYNQALELKQLGFDKKCLAAYFVFGDGKLRDGSYGQTEPQLFINGIGIQVEDRMDELKMFAYHAASVPTFSQAMKFFREKGYMFNIVNDVSASKDGCYYFDVWLSGQILWETDYIFKTYEEAESACLDKLIEIAKTRSL